MKNKTTQPNMRGAVGGRVGAIGAYVILGIFGYMLLFGILFLGLVVSGESGWYLFYIPLCAIPGVVLGPLVLAWRRRADV